MTTNECHFEITPLYCADCGAITGEIGTCADYSTCPKCSRDFAEMNNDPIGTAQINITLAERTPYIGTTEEGEL